MEVAILFFLILLNGLFAMSEMAIAVSRKARLQVMVETGEHGAHRALALHNEPTRFLSTVQIGITSIGVLNGIVGEAAFSGRASAALQAHLGVAPRVADLAATGLVVLTITILSIIFGELVPKRVGQMYPETVARMVAPLMHGLSVATRPLVAVLGATTDAVVRLLGIKHVPSRSVTEEEIAASLEEGLGAGVIEAQEHQMVRNVFRLDERQIGSMMLPRAEISWLDMGASVEQILTMVEAQAHSRYPVCSGSLDEVVGVVSAYRLLAPLALGQPLQLAEHVVPPVFVPETLTGMELLEHFRTARSPLVFVVDEYGAVQGMITERDFLEAITGEIGMPTDEDAWAVQREGGSWLVDGLIPVPELKDRLGLKELPDESRGRYNTLAGMIMLLLGRLPRTADVVEWGGWRFEVVDLDGKRVDKVLASRLNPLEET